MLKKISPRQVRLGMYINALEGSWLKHPFWKTRFLLEDPQDLAALHHSGVQGVWIDCAKGLDVDQAAPASPIEEAPAPTRTLDNTCSAHEEMQQASRILNRSKEAISQLFGEARLGNAVDLDLCRPVVEEIAGSVARNASALISLARLKDKDEYTYMHSVSVCALMIALARQLRLDEEQIHEAGLGGLLHDIGKMGMPLEVLNKPGKLTDAEFAIMRGHPEYGHRILLRSGLRLPGPLDVCLHHHEKIDGSGYPHGLRGEAIGYLARMGAICDVYDAITSQRPYKQAWDAANSLSRMASWEGHFDTRIFHAFVKAVGIYPLGTLVRLNSERLGVVIEQNPEQLTRPVLRVFYSCRSRMAIPMRVLDLSKAQEHDHIISREDPAQWDFDDLDSLWR